MVSTRMLCSVKRYIYFNKYYNSDSGIINFGYKLMSKKKYEGGLIKIE